MPARSTTTIAIICATVSLAYAAPLPVDQTLHVTADHAVASGTDSAGNPSTISAEGHVRVRRGALRLRGLHLFLTRNPRQVTIHGAVYGVDGLMVLTAHKLVYDTTSRTLSLTDGRLALKTGVSPEELYGAYQDNPEALWAAGRNSFVLRADRLTRTDGPDVLAENGYFTTCGCPDGCRPLLSFTAPRIRITPGESATMIWPILRLFDLPIFTFPWFQMPLSNRHTGLLFPQISWTGPGGLEVSVPIFITLGRSADLTLTLHWWDGTSASSIGGVSSASLGVRGFGDEEELRWRPREDAIGSLHVFHAYDTSAGDYSGRRGNREALQLTHVQSLLGGHLGVNIDAVSDNDVLVDTVLPLARRNQPYLRSWAEFSRALGATSLSLETNGIQDLRPGPFPCVPAQPCATQFARTPFTQLPAVAAPIARAVIGQVFPFGRLMNELHLTASLEHALPWERYAPEYNTPGYEVHNGLPATLSGPIDGEHGSRFISDLHLVQTMPVVTSRFGSVVLSAGERAQLLTLLEPGEAGWRAGGYADLFASSRIARTFGSGLVHDVVPSFRVRALGIVQGIGHEDATPFSNGLFPQNAPPLLLQSELDMALPRYSTVQSIARISTSLSRPGQPGAVLALEWHVALAPFDSGQLHPSLDFWVTGLHWSLSAGLDLRQKELTSGSITVTRPIGIGSVSGYAIYINGATDDQVARGMDVLFTPRGEMPSAGVVTPLAAFGAATNVFLGPVRLVTSLNLSTAVAAGSGFTQSYMVHLIYEVQSCGKLSLLLYWVHQPGQPFAVPIPTPDFELESSEGATTAARASAMAPGY